jgi:SAM-dependent methyltransferase
VEQRTARCSIMRGGMTELYDRIGATYTATRRPDPRMAAAIHAALGDAKTLVNVGAGAGAYEPADREVVAIEPSATMIEQRPPGAALAVQATAERLPLRDGGVDAAMAVFSDHHWRDRAEGLREMRRVARQRVVLVNSDPALAERFWFTREYLPEFLDLIPPRYRNTGAWRRELAALLGPFEERVLPIPHDCADGFYQAYWRRPEAYLDPAVRHNISVFQAVPADAVMRALQHLDADLASGVWHARHADVLERDEADLGIRIVVAHVA